MVDDKSRPLLQKVDLKKTLESLFEFRDPLYMSISDHIIETKGKRTKEITLEIESLIAKI